MERIIRSVKKNELEATLTFVERVFTEWENPEEGKLVRGLVDELIADENEAGHKDEYCNKAERDTLCKRKSEIGTYAEFHKRKGEESDNGGKSA